VLLLRRDIYELGQTHTTESLQRRTDLRSCGGPSVIDLSVDLGGIGLLNPVMPASGTFSDSLARIFDLNLLGAIVLKTITRESREGNPLPRVAEVPNGLLNSIGIPSKGFPDFVETVLPLFRQFRPPLIVSISAPTAQAFATLAGDLTLEGIAGLEINLSCPNLEEDGRSFAMSASSTSTVVREIRNATRLPLWIKLTPNTGDIVATARAAESAGADALVVANTFLAMAIDAETFSFRLGNNLGGLSGPAVKPIVLRMVYQTSRAVQIPVIACGGIRNTEDALEYILAGARAVQVGTATFIHPGTMLQIIEGLRNFCERRDVDSILSLIGKVRGRDCDVSVLTAAEARL
jgi:dihydroorotate dehydrogenase (NAD+) catalytic subunit